jgi:hypothetical protein
VSMTDFAHPLAGEDLRDDLRAFVETVLGDLTGNAIMALASGVNQNGKLIVDRDTWFAYPAQLDAMVEFAAKHSNEDVYLGPAVYGDKISVATKRPSRAKSNVLAAQTVWMDSDTCPPEAFRIPPSVHVDTSPGHGHDYWVLPHPVPAADAAEVAHRITTAHADQGCDTNGWSINKLLRMPTMHTHPGDPVPISWESSGAVYDLLDLSGAYDDVQVGQPAVHTVQNPVQVQGLLSAEQVAELVGAIPPTKRRLTDLLLKRPKQGDAGWRSEQRYALMCELLRENYTPQQTASVVWFAPAGAKWREDTRGTEGLWFEVTKAANEIDAEKGRTEAAAAPSTIPERPKVHDGPTLLLPTERRVFVDRVDFTTLYAADAVEKTPVFNAPLHSINALTVLAMAFGASAIIPKAEAPMPLNLFSIQISRSSTGKTQAARIMERYIEALYPLDDVFVPVDSSKNALVENLLERDGSVALLRGDEAHGQFRLMENATWTAGLRETWTDIYDGKVSGIGRVGQKDLRKRAFVAASMHLSGTPEDMFDTLTRGMFKSGYAARQIWVLGEDHEVTEDSLRTKQGHTEHEWDDLPAYQASLAAHQVATTKRGLHARLNLLLTEDAMARFDEAKMAIHKHFEHSDDPEIFTPATRRMWDIIWKVAGLFALEDGRSRISKPDILTALGYAEVWLDTLVTVSQKISSTLFSKAVDDIERFIASKEGREAPVSAIFGRFSGERPKFIEEYIDALIKQRRAYEPHVKQDAERRIRLKETHQ